MKPFHNAVLIFAGLCGSILCLDSKPTARSLIFPVPVVALLTAGVEMDVLGIGYSDFAEADRKAVVQAYPRTEHFKEDIIQAFYDGIKNKPETTFGNVKADVLADKDASFQRGNFCRVIRGSAWRGRGRLRLRARFRPEFRRSNQPRDASVHLDEVSRRVKLFMQHGCST